MNNTVFLLVNGREWGGWTSVSISAGIDRLARDFNVTITRRWPGAGSSFPKIENGDRVEVKIGEDPVITGWVEATPVRYDSSNIAMSIVGRSLTADLIDCAAVPVQFKGLSLTAIAQELAKPFGVKVIDLGVPTDKILESQAQHGEKVIDALHRALSQVQTLAYDDASGALVLGQIGADKAATALVLGENILACDSEQSVRDCFSDYLVTGQRPGNDKDFGRATLAAIKQTAKDPNVTRYRPTTIQETGAATTANCKARCDFEAALRAAKVEETTYTVQGWRQGSGELWRPNMRVIVFDPLLGFNNDELIIAEVTFTLGEGGSTTELRVGPADAYLPEPAKPPKIRKKRKKRAGAVF